MTLEVFISKNVLICRAVLISVPHFLSPGHYDYHKWEMATGISRVETRITGRYLIVKIKNDPAPNINISQVSP